MPKFALAIVAIITLSACSGCSPKAKPIEGKVAESLATSATEVKSQEGEVVQIPGVDHSAYDALLTKYVDFEGGRVDYSGLKSEQAQLDAYIADLEKAELDQLTRNGQLALLINAYNAFTLKLILENYGEIDSIRDLSDPWGTKRWVLEGDKVSLDDIEHGLIRPIFKDPRIHFAVNCASIGCPPLANFAFTGAELQSQLDRVATTTLSNPRYAAVEGGELRVTKLLDWYGEDFTKEGWSPTADSVAEWVAERSTDEVQTHVEANGTDISYFDYDWNLNDVD